MGMITTHLQGWTVWISWGYISFEHIRLVLHWCSYIPIHNYRAPQNNSNHNNNKRCKHNNRTCKGVYNDKNFASVDPMPKCDDLQPCFRLITDLVANHLLLLMSLLNRLSVLATTSLFHIYIYIHISLFCKCFVNQVFDTGAQHTNKQP